MNFFHHKDLGNHLLPLCPKVVKHPVYGTQLHGAHMGYRVTGDAFKWDSKWATAFRGQKFTCVTHFIV